MAGGFLSVEIVQPRPWERWDTEFGDTRRAIVLAEPKGIKLGGGTVIMIKLADEIDVGTRLRSVQMLFKRGSEPKRAPGKSTKQ
jgi:hypothetical protein